MKSLEDSGLLLKGVSETIQNEAKKQKGGFLCMLLGTLGASLLGIMLAGKGVNRTRDGIIRAGYGSSESKVFKFRLILSLILKYKNIIRINLRFNRVYSRNNLLDKMKDGEYIINLDECSDVVIPGSLCMH